MKKLYVFLILFVIYISSVFANTCGGTLPPGNVVTNADSCLSCHVKIVPVYEKNRFGFNTDTITEYVAICADEFLMFWGNFWTSDDEFNKKYPTGEIPEKMYEDIARENTPIEQDRVIYEEKKSKLNEALLVAWGLNVAIVKLVIELLLIVMYLVELLLVIFVFIVIIPHLFFAMKDAIVRNYMKKSGRKR